MSMERYSHLQAMPNSPLTPLTPLNENTKFEFNFGGDGSLDEYIKSVRLEHRVEQQQKKLLEYANQSFNKKLCPLQPKRYSEEFLKIRDVFETHEQNQIKQHNCHGKCQHEQQQLDKCKALASKLPVVKITYTTPTRRFRKIKNANSTPTNIRTPLKPKNRIFTQNLNSKLIKDQQKQKLTQLQQHQHHQLNKDNRVFLQASPVAAKPLCSKVANILKQRGLSMYCDLFQREEIDLFAFHLLKLQELQQMGITNKKHCAILMQEIYYAGQYF